MPSIDLTDAELSALVALIRRAVEQDRFPRAPRVDIRRSALAKLDPEAHRSPPAAESAAPAPQAAQRPPRAAQGSPEAILVGHCDERHRRP